MKESTFINQNKDKWKHYEEVLKSKAGEADELNALFIQVTDDLSYARSFYKNRSVRVYLNALAQSVFLRVYTKRKRSQSFVSKFFKDELPAILFDARKEMLVCFLIFIVTLCAGVFSSIEQTGFARQILGNEYVDMTLSNIKNGKPMNIYSQGGELESFLKIAYNNLRVDLLTFVTGLFFSIGALFVLAYNGVMVGVFQYLFYGSGYFGFTVLTIWLHGTLEMFAMILSATAGLVMGKGLIFPGTYTRFEAFRISAIRGVKILIVVIPLTLIAAIIESFITGQTAAPQFLKISLISVCLGFIFFYFIWYPWRRFHGQRREPPIEEIPYRRETEIHLNEIKSIGEIIIDMFRVWRKQLNKISFLVIPVGLAVILFSYLFQGDFLTSYHLYSTRLVFSLKMLKLGMWFSNSVFKFWPLLLVGFAAYCTYLLWLVFSSGLSGMEKKPIYALISVFILHLVTLYFFYISSSFWINAIFFLLIFPLNIFIGLGFLHQGIKGVARSFTYFYKSMLDPLLTNLSLVILLSIFFLLTTSPIISFLSESIVQALKISDPDVLKFEKLISLTLGMVFMGYLVSMYIFANAVLYYSNAEKVGAERLKKQLELVWS